MNKFKLHIIGWLLAFFGIASFCNADNVSNLINYNYTNLVLTWFDNWNNSISRILIDLWTSSSNYWTYCFTLTQVDSNASNKWNIVAYIWQNASTPNWNYSDFAWQNTRNSIWWNQIWNTTCFVANKRYIVWLLRRAYTGNPPSESYFHFNVYKLDTLLNTTIPSCETMSSLDCQLEYNLIPLNEITSNYCKINFDLIEPTECPWNNTGDIIFSNLYINNTRYQWASNIFLRINDSLLYTYNYSGWQITIDVDYDVDPDYIEDIINKERLTPTNQDFENLITWMQYYIPYIMIALLLWRAVFVFKKVFKF